MPVSAVRALAADEIVPVGLRLGAFLPQAQSAGGVMDDVVDEARADGPRANIAWPGWSATSIARSRETISGALRTGGDSRRFSQA